MINVWFAITTTDIQDIKSRWSDLGPNVKEALQSMKADAHWKRLTVGQKTYVIVDTNSKKNWMQKLVQAYPDTVILGAWDMEGNILHPIHARILDIMPDDVVYDADGNEVSRTPATAPKQCHKWLGQKDRKWS